MPQLGETVAEGKITKWFKSAGEPVKPGDNLFEIETDKVSMEVPATTAACCRRSALPSASRAGRRRGRGDRRRRAAPRQVERPTPRPSPPQPPPAATSRHSAASLRRPQRRGIAMQPRRPRSRSQLDPFLEVRTPERNYGPARLAGRHRRHAAGAAARRRGRHRSVAHRRLRPAWPHRRPRRRAAPPRRAAGDAPPRRQRCRVKALYAAAATRRCRSTPCARPSPRGWSRPSRPSRISI